MKEVMRMTGAQTLGKMLLLFIGFLIFSFIQKDVVLTVLASISIFCTLISLGFWYDAERHGRRIAPLST